jgi:hypothetical protein
MKSRTIAALLTAVAVVALAGTQAAQAGTSSIALKFHLPFNGSVNSSKTGFKITNGGSGNGLEGDSTGSGIGVYGGAGSNSLAGVLGFAQGGVTGVWGTSGGGDGVRGTTSGSGNGVEGTSANGNGLYGTSTGGYGASAWTTNGFAGIGGFTSGANNGVYGEANNSTASGVYGHNDGTGNGVAGISDKGAGGFFQGKTAGAYFAASGGGSSPAIKIGSGGIQVSGAGLDSATPVFSHQATFGNTCDGNKFTALDNPYLNGNPNALVLLTPTNVKSGYGNLETFYNTGGLGDCPVNRWVVTPDLGTWDTAYFNTFFVLVFNP